MAGWEIYPLLNNAKNNELKEQVRTQIRRDLELQRVSIENVAGLFPFKQRTLQRRLKAAGTSYQKLLKHTRITMAMEILNSSGIPITRLSDRLCFCDLANFCKAFKQYTGCTPRQWRELSRLEIARKSKHCVDE